MTITDPVAVNFIKEFCVMQRISFLLDSTTDQLPEFYMGEGNESLSTFF